MGSLKPGATYIYERADGITYARESGADPSTRTAIGWDYDPNRPGDGSKTYADIKQAKLWKSIREAAEYNLTLQDAMNNMLEIYELVKTHERQT